MDRVSREYHLEGTEPGCRLLTLNAQSESEFKMQLQAQECGTVDIYENTPRYEFGCIAGYDSRPPDIRYSSSVDNTVL